MTTAHPAAAPRRLWLAAASSYGVGQLANFLFQLQLLHLLGAADYSAVGLAHLLLVTLIFLADLGYSSIFLREPPHRDGWQTQWRQALGHKLVATAVLMAVAALAGPWLWADNAASRGYLLAAAPACLLAVGNFSSPLIAAGRRVSGLLVAQVAWPTALLLWCLLQGRLALSTAACAGLAVSLGYGVQACVSVVCSGRLRLWLPAWGRGQLASALQLSLLGVCGILHDRLTPFLLAPLAPGFLPFFLILGHVLNGLSGVLVQVARLLLPVARTERGHQHSLAGASLVLWATAVVLAAGLLGQGLTAPGQQRQWLALGMIVVLAWGVSASSSFLTTLLISQRRERSLMRLLVVGLGVSALLQGCAALAGEPTALLWARSGAMLATLAGLGALLGLRPTARGVVATALALLACLAGGRAWGLAAGALLAVPALAGVLRQWPCWQERNPCVA
ncbi:hypothetical protein LZ023_32475 [Pseudomonas silvicola]|nr:hypothetical protein LZ023_32475 [Pseudomonas silvicola]